MCDKSNAQEIVSEMIVYLEHADYSIREEMVSILRRYVTPTRLLNYHVYKFLPLNQGRILVEIVGEVVNNLGEVQRSSSRPPWKARAYCRLDQSQRRDVCI